MDAVTKAAKREENLTPWPKGKSGNPAGKAKGQRSFATIYREALIKIGESQNMTPEEIENLLVQSGLKNALKGDYRFYQDVMDRTHGKPIQENKTDLTSQGEKLLDQNAIVQAIVSALK